MIPSESDRVRSRSKLHRRARIPLFFLSLFFFFFFSLCRFSHWLFYFYLLLLAWISLFGCAYCWILPLLLSACVDHSHQLAHRDSAPTVSLWMRSDRWPWRHLKRREEGKVQYTLILESPKDINSVERAAWTPTSKRSEGKTQKHWCITGNKGIFCPDILRDWRKDRGFSRFQPLVLYRTHPELLNKRKSRQTLLSFSQGIESAWASNVICLLRFDSRCSRPLSNQLRMIHTHTAVRSWLDFSWNLGQARGMTQSQTTI